MDETSRGVTERGIGLAAAVPAEVALVAASRAQESGYHSFWLNNPPGAHALETLGNAARTASDIWLGVGVIPLSDQPAEEIVRQVKANDIPLDRFYLGIGSGSGSGGVRRVREGVRTIRAQLSGSVVVAALGPRMCRLAGAEGDGVLLNWLTPDFARTAVGWVREGAEEADRPVPRLMAYVRAALGQEAGGRLREEARRYDAIPHYATHFRRMGASAIDTAVTGDTPEEIQRGLAAWDGIVDEVVIRAITARDTVEDVVQLMEAAKPRS